MRSTNIADLRNRVDDADAPLVASGLMRKGSGTLPAAFWKTRRSRVTRQVAVVAVRADRDED